MIRMKKNDLELLQQTVEKIQLNQAESFPTGKQQPS